MIEVSSELGLVALVVVAALFVHSYMMLSVGAARRKYGVRLPNLYALESENKDARVFNCVQRGHQNFLEVAPFFLSLLLTAGLQHPRIATVAGAFFLVARIIYFRDYSTGDPKKRITGVKMASVALLVLVICSVSFTAHQFCA